MVVVARRVATKSCKCLFEKDIKNSFRCGGSVGGGNATNSFGHSMHPLFEPGPKGHSWSDMEQFPKHPPYFCYATADASGSSSFD